MPIGGVVWFHKQSDYDRAIEDYNRAIDLNPDHADAYSNRGLVCEIKGDYDRAIEDYNKAIELKPDLAEAYRGRFATNKAIMTVPLETTTGR